MLVTWLVFQLPMFWLKADAPSNRLSMSLTLPVFQTPSG